ncbi:MAG: NACHT domain-containing protein [Cyanobacteria bacterium P01_H01_bin.26]
MSVFGEAVNGVIGPVFDATWNMLKKQYYAGLHKTELKQKKLKIRQGIKRASKIYHQKYLDRHCNIKVLPGLMKEAMSLETIYTAVKFIDKSDLRYYSTLEALEELYRQANRRQLRVGNNKRQDGLSAANQKQHLMVLGGPGVGKSTFLRKLGLEALQGGLDHYLMPVFVELKSFKNKEQTLVQAIVKELKLADFPGPEILVESMLKAGKMLILLDGLDEVPLEQENTVIDKITYFCDRYSQNRFVISCRIASYKGGFNRFVDVTMAEFDDEQIKEFINRWFSSELDKNEGTAKKFCEILYKPKNLAAKELAQTPLLLTFLCLVYDRSQSLLAVRSTLYGDALNILLKDWAAEKRLERDEIYQGFHTDLEKELLAEVAYSSFVEDQLFFSKDEITERISTFLSDTLGAPTSLDGVTVLEAIEKQQGVLVERANDTYSFSHLTLQEYLVAKHISNQWMIDELVITHLTDKRWREVFLLVSGLTGRRSHELWLAMEKRASGFINLPKVQSLLRWVAARNNNLIATHEALAIRGLFLSSILTFASARANAKVRSLESATNAPVGKLARASVSANANAKALASASASASASAHDLTTTTIIASTRASKVARDLVSGITVAIATASDIVSDIAIARASNVASARARARAHDSASKLPSVVARACDIARANTIPSDVNFPALADELGKLAHQLPSPNEVSAWKKLAKKLTYMYLNAFHLDESLMTLSQDEAQTIDEYLYSVKLILDCKASAVRVSRKKWETIEARLLTAPIN